jgi:hypothetical protein
MSPGPRLNRPGRILGHIRSAGSFECTSPIPWPTSCVITPVSKARVHRSAVSYSCSNAVAPDAPQGICDQAKIRPSRSIGPDRPVRLAVALSAAY